MKKIIKIILPLILGTIVGLLIKNNIDYNELIKPALAPPGFIFPIIWTILYILMGISYTLTNNKKITKVYYLQLIINLLWTIIFFKLKWYFLAIIWIIILDILVIWMIYLMIKEKKIAGYIQIPYLIWILFATYLTIFIYILN